MNKNQGCQEKKLNLGITKIKVVKKKFFKLNKAYNKNQGCLEKKVLKLNKDT